MGSDFSFTLDGADELMRVLQQVPKESGTIVGQALYEEAQVIFAKSQLLVPVDTGALRGSGDVSAPEALGNGNIAVDIYYGGTAAPYALLVHELLQYHHASPTQAKYLERPFLEAMPNIKKHLASRIMSLIQEKAR